MPIDMNYLKDIYFEACRKAKDAGVKDVGHTGWTLEMLGALSRMARADVYPDGRFGDDECNVWSLFHLATAK